MPVAAVLKTIEDEEIRYVDLRFSDLRGTDHHLTVPAHQIDIDVFEDGKMFDGSSFGGWKGVHESDMVLLPDAATAVVDPFFEDKTLILRCDILEPSTGQGYERDPRSVAKRAEAYLRASGIGEFANFGPEPEFFIFDGVRYRQEMRSGFYEIESGEGYWSSALRMDGSNPGHRPGIKGGYLPVPPRDSLHEIRATMCNVLEQIGLPVEVHHHEVATAGQCEIGTRFDTLVKRADSTQLLKYVVHNVAHGFGKTATFMPKPLVGDNGSGMHVHQSLTKGGVNLFAGDGYGGLSELALHYIGGIIKHARALNAFTNPTTNSYKRLVPGFEAPIMLAYSARNRSASIRIPWISNPKARRIEVRFPDPAANPYLAFAAMLMAGLDGIKNKIDPGEPMDKDLYDLKPEEAKHIPTVCHGLDLALEHLDRDREFLKVGGVFSDEMIDAYIELKMSEVTRFRTTPHPLEFELYYSC